MENQNKNETKPNNRILEDRPNLPDSIRQWAQKQKERLKKHSSLSKFVNEVSLRPFKIPNKLSSS